MPIDKALKINAVITGFMLRTLDKWRTLGRTDWNQELTRQRMESLSRCDGLERRRENQMARALHESEMVSSLGALAFHQVLVNPKAPDF